MNYLSKSALAASLLTCTVTALASNSPHHNDHHWNIGLQGAIGSATAINQSDYETSLDADNFYAAGYTVEKNHSSHSKTIGLYGAHLGYEWFDGESSSWELDLSANLFASGNVNGEYQINDAMTEDDGAATGLSSQQTAKLREQYNLELHWKHAINSDTYFSMGLGASRITVNNLLALKPNQLLVRTGSNFAQTTHPFGATVSIGVGYNLSEHASFDMNLGYAMYHAKHLQDTPQLDAEHGDDTPEYMRNRTTKINLMTLTAGYSYHF